MSPASLDTTIVVSLVCRRAEMDDSEPPRFAVVGPDTIPTGVRRRMALALTDLWQRGHGRGPKQFFPRLHLEGTSEDEEQPRPSPHPRRLVEGLEREWERARNELPSEAHDRLRDFERDVAEELGEMIEYRAKVVPDREHEEARSAIIGALEGARQQVALALPDGVSHDAELLDQLRAAADRGVSVFLLGQDPKEHEVLARILAEVTNTPRGGSVVVPTGLISSGAQVVVCDMDWAHVSAGRGSRPWGARIFARDPGLVARGVAEILAWLRKQITDVRLRRTMLDSPALFGRHTDGIEIMPEIPQPQDGPFAKLWAAAWTERVREHRVRVDEAMPMAIPVFDGAHREILELAVPSAARRLLIGSATESPSALPLGLASGLVDAVRRGVDVRVMLDARLAPGPDLLRQSTELEAGGVRVERSANPGAVLVCDDWCVVGSYRYLLPTQSLRRELGLRIFGDEEVDTIYAWK